MLYHNKSSKGRFSSRRNKEGLCNAMGHRNIVQGIEICYRIMLLSFKKGGVEYIMQEIYARLILYNYCELITMHVIIQQKGTKHVYQMNYTIAIHICRYFLRNDISPPDVETLIQKNLLPVRPGRSDPRKVKPKSAVSFLYRVA